jgi:hypothetical protein
MPLPSTDFLLYGGFYNSYHGLLKQVGIPFLMIFDVIQIRQEQMKVVAHLKYMSPTFTMVYYPPLS